MSFIAEFIKVLHNISWPIAIYLILSRPKGQSIIIAVIRLLDRTSSIKYKDAKIETYGPQATKVPSTNSDFDKKLPDSANDITSGDKSSEDYFYKSEEEYLKHPYKLSIENERNIRSIIKNSYQNKPSKELDNHLIETLAENIAIKNYLWIRCNIMPEQFELLRQLNVAPLKSDQAKHYYNFMLQRLQITETDYSFDEFMVWVLNQSLVIQKGALYEITMLGNEFLSFLVRNRIP